ncbi:hypothetical protein HDU87_000155 [Geranomyces variabilis]|uniref:Uncharacterized protein n=1 Tax=Geranomyces variabilis TaxID=109894 RepID=A0AAD5XU49_9FUNG|nr:hypothetical protein HDU87_000155 [Geranomyces variabilis]
MNYQIPSPPLGGMPHINPQLQARPKQPPPAPLQPRAPAGLSVDTMGAIAAFVHSTASGRAGECSDATAPTIAAFWQLEPQEFKRQANLNLLANNAVYDAGLQTPISPVRPGVLPCELFPRKEDFVESLVDTAAAMLELQFRANPAPNGKRLVPLKCFIEELLKRSRTSFSTLQLALLYLLRFKQTMGTRSEQHQRGSPGAKPTATSCARRMFLSALIVANKYLQDRNYSNTAWSRICGLSPAELTKNESAFLSVMDWKLFVPKTVFVRWSTMLLTASAQMTKKKAAKKAELKVEGGSVSPTPLPLNVSFANDPRALASTAYAAGRQRSLAPLTPPVDFGVAKNPSVDSNSPASSRISSPIDIADLWTGAERVEDMTLGTPADGYLPSPETRSVKLGSKRGIDLVDDDEDDVESATARRHVGWPTTVV